MNRVRVLIVEDSLTIRKYLSDVLSSDPQFEVVGEAENGRRAIELCEALRPDVITMDMMLPVMSGVAATEYIMAYCPTPILIVSASINRGEVFRTYEALSAGAIDVLDKPKATGTADAWEQKLRSTVKMISRIKVITHPRGRLRAKLTVPEVRVSQHGQTPDLIVLGASTGGPAAISDILRALPADFPIPIVVVIHISEQFAFALGEWLGTQCRIPVVQAVHNSPVPAVGQSVITLPAPGRHLLIDGGRFVLSDGPERHSCKPSIDVLFESVANSYGPRAVLCLLTGMGKDGATGMLAAKKAGALTIAQDEATSAVFGMPGEAAKLGAAEKVLPLDQIAPALLYAARQIRIPQ